jgi:hypothetical protein
MESRGKAGFSALDIHEDDEFDEAQLIAWVKQASQLPGHECERPTRGACAA